MSRAKTSLLLALCAGLITAAGFSIHRTQFAAPAFNEGLHRAVGRALAEETARVLTNAGRIVLVSVETAGLPELKAQMDEFERTLQRFPRIQVKETYRLEAEEKAKYSFGSGLSGRRYVRLVNKNLSADAFVSFIGAPRLSASELAELRRTPHLIAESRAPDKLRKSFDQRIIDVAVVSRFQFPAPVQGTPRNLQEWLDQRWQIVTTNNCASLPGGDNE